MPGNCNTPPALKNWLKGCRKGDRNSQHALYRHFYSYAMGVSLRYAYNHAEAEEIVNDGFIKVFTQIHKHRKISSFKSWLRGIMVYTAIDHYRRNHRHYHQVDIEVVHGLTQDLAPDCLSTLSAEEILEMVQALPPAYRLVFNLYEIEGFSHKEISDRLEISTGTSKSNLARARLKLRKMLSSIDKEYIERYG